MSIDFQKDATRQLAESFGELLPPESTKALNTWRNVSAMKLDADDSLSKALADYQQRLIANAGKGISEIPKASDLARASNTATANDLQSQCLLKAREQTLTGLWNQFSMDREQVHSVLARAYNDQLEILQDATRQLAGVDSADVAIDLGRTDAWRMALDASNECARLGGLHNQYRHAYNIRPQVDRGDKYRMFQHPDRLKPERSRDDGSVPSPVDRLLARLGSLHADPWLPSPAQQDELAQRELDARQAEQARLEAQPGRMLLAGISAA